MQALSKDYRCAQTNGFVGSQEEYVKLRYEYYRATMKRNNIEPKNWVKWLLTLK